MKKSKLPSGFLFKLIISFATVWALSIVVFGSVIAIATKGFTATVQDTQFGNSTLYLILLLGSMGIGSLAFGILVLAIIIKVILEKKVLEFRRSFVAVALLVGSIIIILALWVSSGGLGNPTLKTSESYPKNPIISPTENPMPQPTTKPTSLPVRIPTVAKSGTQPSQPPKANLPVLNGSNIFNMVNAFRAANGKPGLSVSDELCRLAETRADYMMANNMAAFKSSKTGGHTGLIDVSSQYSGSGVGENLAANLGTDAAVIEIWGNSPPHRELMLWTEKNGFPIAKGCIATRVSEVGSITVLFVGDK